MNAFDGSSFCSSCEAVMRLSQVEKLQHDLAIVRTVSAVGKQFTVMSNDFQLFSEILHSGQLLTSEMLESDLFC